MCPALGSNWRKTKWLAAKMESPSENTPWTEIYLSGCIPCQLSRQPMRFLGSGPGHTERDALTHRVRDPLLHQYILMGVTTLRAQIRGHPCDRAPVLRNAKRTRTRFRCGRAITVVGSTTPRPQKSSCPTKAFQWHIVQVFRFAGVMYFDVQALCILLYVTLIIYAAKSIVTKVHRWLMGNTQVCIS